MGFAVIEHGVPYKARLLKYENIQSICSLEKYHRVSPTEEELTGLKEAILEIQRVAQKHVFLLITRGNLQP